MVGRLKREGPYVYSWLIHVVVWPKPTQHCKAIILQIKSGFLKSSHGKGLAKLWNTGCSQQLILHSCSQVTRACRILTSGLLYDTEGQAWKQQRCVTLSLKQCPHDLPSPALLIIGNNWHLNLQAPAGWAHGGMTNGIIVNRLLSSQPCSRRWVNWNEQECFLQNQTIIYYFPVSLKHLSWQSSRNFYRLLQHLVLC